MKGASNKAFMKVLEALNLEYTGSYTFYPAKTHDLWQLRDEDEIVDRSDPSLK